MPDCLVFNFRIALVHRQGVAIPVDEISVQVSGRKIPASIQEVVEKTGLQIRHWPRVIHQGRSPGW